MFPWPEAACNSAQGMNSPHLKYPPPSVKRIGSIVNFTPSKTLRRGGVISQSLTPGCTLGTSGSDTSTWHAPHSIANRTKSSAKKTPSARTLFGTWPLQQGTLESLVEKEDRNSLWLSERFPDEHQASPQIPDQPEELPQSCWQIPAAGKTPEAVGKELEWEESMQNKFRPSGLQQNSAHAEIATADQRSTTGLRLPLRANFKEKDDRVLPGVWCAAPVGEGSHSSSGGVRPVEESLTSSAMETGLWSPKLGRDEMPRGLAECLHTSVVTDYEIEPMEAKDIFTTPPHAVSSVPSRAKAEAGRVTAETQNSQHFPTLAQCQEAIKCDTALSSLLETRGGDSPTRGNLANVAAQLPRSHGAEAHTQEGRSTLPGLSDQPKHDDTVHKEDHSMQYQSIFDFL